MQTSIQHQMREVPLETTQRELPRVILPDTSSYKPAVSEATLHYFAKKNFSHLRQLEPERLELVLGELCEVRELYAHTLLRTARDLYIGLESGNLGKMCATGWAYGSDLLELMPTIEGLEQPIRSSLQVLACVRGDISEARAQLQNYARIAERYANTLFPTFETVQ